MITGACLAVTLIALAGCQATAPQFTAQDEATVRGMFDSTVANLRAADFSKWSEQFTDDAVLQPPNAAPVHGRAGILAWGQAFPPIEEVSFFDVQTSGEGNMAYGTSAYALKLRGVPADTGKQLVIFRRAAGGPWQIPAVSFSSNLPMPAPAPASGMPKQ